jgi:hypothetical protein
MPSAPTLEFGTSGTEIAGRAGSCRAPLVRGATAHDEATTEDCDMTTRPSCDNSAWAPSAQLSGGSSIDDPELERIWLSTRAVEWRSLALVPASDDVRVVELAQAFSALGLRDQGESIGVADLRDVPVPNLRGPLEVIRWYIQHGERVIVVLRPCFQSAATAPMVRAADCAILCLALGETRIAEANATVEEIGPDAFIGTVLVRPDTGVTASRPTTAYRRLKALP